jgi:hypothetical protein
MITRGWPEGGGALGHEELPTKVFVVCAALISTFTPPPLGEPKFARLAIGMEPTVSNLLFTEILVVPGGATAKLKMSSLFWLPLATATTS